MFEDEELQALLYEDFVQTKKLLAEQLRVTQTTVFKRLHAIGKN